MAEPKETNATTTPATDDAVGKLAAALSDKIAPAIEARVLAAVEAKLAAPVVTQTSQQAIDAHTKTAQERMAAATTPEQRLAIVSDLEAKLADQEKEAKAKLEQIRRTTDMRQSAYDLGEVKAQIEETAGVPHTETKDFWRHLTNKAQRTPEWDGTFGDLTPLEVVIRGAIAPKDFTFDNGGTRKTVKTCGAFSCGSKDLVVREAQEANDVLMTWMLWKQARGEQYFGLHESPFYPRYKAAMEGLGTALMGKTAMTGGSLANMVPTGFSATLVERFELERNLTRFIPFFQMTQNPQTKPRRGGFLSVYGINSTTSNPEDATKITASTTSPGLLTLSLHDFAIRCIFDIGAEEDTLPALAQTLPEDMARSWVYALEDAILNSDGATFHMDVDISGTTTARIKDYRRTWYGLRALAIDNSYTTSLTGGSGADGSFNSDVIIGTMAANMGKYSAKAGDRICVVGPKVRAICKTLRNSADHPMVQGAASPGPVPMVSSGFNMESIDGSPLVVVESARENLNASGFYDGTTTNLGTLMWVNTPTWVLAAKNQRGRLATNFETSTGQSELFMYQRYEFESELDITANRTVELGIGVTIAG